MIKLLIKFLKMLFYQKRKDRLPRVPRSFTTEYDRRVSRDVERVFHRSAARSPEGVTRLMRRKRVKNIQELLPMLPMERKRKSPRERFVMWLMRLNGELPYDPAITALRKLRLSRNQTLIRRTPHRGSDNP